MKYSALLVAGALAAVSAAQMPTCAISCLNDATLAATNCRVDDIACKCKPENQSKIQAHATPCVISSCGIDVAVGEVIPAARDLCAGYQKRTSTDEVAAEPAATTDVETSKVSGAPSSVVTSTSTVAPSASVPAETTASSRASKNGTAPTSSITPVVTAGAAILGSIGSIGMLLLGALAL